MLKKKLALNPTARLRASASCSRWLSFSPVLPFFLSECQRPVAHECLGEVLRVLRQVINTYPLLNTVEILTAAGKLISKVKGQPELQRMSRDYIKTADPFHF